MNRSFLLAVSAALIITAGLVAAQVNPGATTGTYAPRPSVGHCMEKQVQMLYAATKADDPLQEGYLRAAQAYRELEAAGQPC